MIFNLFKKELRQLIPLAIFMIIITVSDIVFRLVDGRLDAASWSDISGYVMPGNDSGYGVFYTIFAFMFAFSLFPREHDEKTIDFLYSLPIKRISVFFAKFFAAFIILQGTLLLGVIQDWILHLFNSQHFSGNQFDLKIALTAWFLMASFITIMLSFGVFLSFFRRFGLVLFGVYVWMIYSFEKIYPSFTFLNFINLLSMEYSGQTLLVPWKLLCINLLLAGISLVMGVFLWITPSERFAMWYHRLRQKRWGRVLSGLSIVFVIILLILLMDKIINDGEYSDKTGVSYTSFGSSTLSTSHYQFTYPLNLREKAQTIIKSADGVYEQTRNLMSADHSNPIIVDLTEKSNEHAGIAGLHKIRMDIRRNMDVNERLRILSHETVHVLALLESDHEISKFQNETYFFNEGLAEHVSFQVFPDEKKLFMQRLLAAAAWQRYNIEFNELADSSLFLKKYSSILFYNLGEMWVSAVSKVCGNESFARLLRTMARSDAPSDIEGIVFWQDTFQAMNCDLEGVNEAWLKELKDISTQFQVEIDKLPRIAGGVSETKGKHVILIARIDREVPDKGILFYVRYRSSWNENEEDVGIIYGNVLPHRDPVEIEFAIPLHYLPNKKFEYQLGYSFGVSSLPYYESWQSGEWH